MEGFLEKDAARSVGPSLGHAIAERSVTHKNEARPAILRHSDEFGGRLTEIQWHDNRAFGHERQMESCPANGVGREKSATITRLGARAAKEQTNQLNLIEQFPARHADKAITVNFAKNHAATGALQLSNNRF